MNNSEIQRYESIIEDLEDVSFTLRKESLALVKALEEIINYWNRDRNEEAMHDACWHSISTAQEALDNFHSKRFSSYVKEEEELRADAERYRYLRDSSSDDLCVVRIDYWSDEYVGTAGVEVIDGHHLDSDVDAARAAGGEE